MRPLLLLVLFLIALPASAQLNQPVYYPTYQAPALPAPSPMYIQRQPYPGPNPQVIYTNQYPSYQQQPDNYYNNQPPSGLGRTLFRNLMGR